MDKAKGKETGATSRRKFIKRLGGGALASATAATLSSVGCSTHAQEKDWSATYDWICIGSGVAGCAAAIRGHDAGMKTLLIEKMDKIGGITAQAGSALWVPLSYLTKEKGIVDSREDAMKYMEFVGGGYSRPEYREAYVDNAARVLEYLHQKAEMPFQGGTGTEFFDAVAPGAKKGRSHGIQPFHTESLGDWRDKLRMTVHVGGLVDALEDGYNPKVTGSGPARADQRQMDAWKKRLGAAKFDELVKKDEEVRTGGAALVGYLFAAVLKRGIPVRTGTSAEQLVVENGRVVGIVVKSKGQEERLRSNRGVLLAMGGDPIRPLGDPFAWMLATTAGAATHTEPIVVPRISLPVPGEALIDGSPFSRSEVDRPHSIVVNRFGQRFGNESFFQDIGAAVNHFENWKTHRFENVPNYLIFDHNLLEKYTFGGMPPGESDSLEWVAKGQTLRDVAEKLKIDARGLEAAVSRYNEFAHKGKDMDFNRTSKSMAPLEKGPFYGVETDTPDPFEGWTFVMATPSAQVIHYRTKAPIPGLYGSGAIVANQVIWGMGYQAGFELMGGMIFAFLAAEHAVAAA